MTGSIRIKNIVWIFSLKSTTLIDSIGMSWRNDLQCLYFALVLFVVPLKMYLSHKYFALFYLWDAMSMRLHRTFHYDDDDYYYSYTNDDDGRCMLVRTGFQTVSIAKSFLFSEI